MDLAKRLVAWSPTRALVGCKAKSKSPECYTSFCCPCFADFETAFVASVASTCNEKTKTARGFCSPFSGIFVNNYQGNLPSAAPRSKASSALILKLLSASQQTSHKNKNKKNKKNKGKKSQKLNRLFESIVGAESSNVTWTFDSGVANDVASLFLTFA